MAIMLPVASAPASPLLAAANPALMKPFLSTIHETIAKGDYSDVIRSNRNYRELPVREMSFFLKADDVVHRLQLRINILRYNDRCLFKFHVVEQKDGNRLLAYAYPEDSAMQGTSIASLRERLTMDGLLEMHAAEVMELAVDHVYGIDDVITTFLSAQD